MPNSLPSWIAGSFLVLCSLSPLESVSAQAQLAADSLKSEIYFGSRTADGQTVGERAWEEFVAQVIAPRFPAGLTILEGRGRSGAAAELQRSAFNSTHEPTAPLSHSRFRLRARRCSCPKKTLPGDTAPRQGRRTKGAWRNDDSLWPIQSSFVPYRTQAGSLVRDDHSTVVG